MSRIFESGNFLDGFQLGKFAPRENNPLYGNNIVAIQTYKDHCSVFWHVFSLSFGQQGLAEAELALATGTSLVTSAKFEAQESIKVAPGNYKHFRLLWKL